MKTWIETLKHNAVQLFIACDQLLNVVLTFFTVPAWADETLSSRAWRADVRGLWFGRIFRPVIDLLFCWQTLRPDALGHCHQAYLKERDRAGLPPEFRS